MLTTTPCVNVKYSSQIKIQVVESGTIKFLMWLHF